MKPTKLALLIVLLALLAAFWWLDLGHYLSLDYLKASQATFRTFFGRHPWLTPLLYVALYVAVTGLSLPGAAVLTLAGGALFGLVEGTLLVSFASSIGALLAFLLARYLFRDSVRQRFGTKLAVVEQGFAREGPFYLFALRLVPLFPFFLVNLVAGLLPIRAWTFYWVSQIGMLAGTLAYVNAGTQLATLSSVRGILSPGVLLSFAALGILPLLARKTLSWFRQQHVYRRWSKPRRFDRNLIVIGGGAAGLVSAYIGAATKAKVTLIECHKMGGDCLNYGCVPSKALIRSAKFLHQCRNASALGIQAVETKFDFAEVMGRVARVVKTVEPHDSVERYRQLGVEVIHGHANITSPWQVEVNGRTLTSRAIVLATGSRPVVPTIPGLQEVGFLTSETLWSLTERPGRLVVLGGGPIGCELAQAFARFGSQVTQVVKEARLLKREDEEVSQYARAALERDGVSVLTDHRTLRVECNGNSKRMWLRHENEDVAIEFDVVLCAVGRQARTEGFGLEELGIPMTGRKTIETDAYLQTLYPSIYACGDVAGPYQFTHTAAHQAWYASINALFGRFKRFKVDYSAIPWVTFTDPEIAKVGLSEQEACEQGIAYEVTRYNIEDLDRAIADEAAAGFIKVLTPPGKDRILGVVIVGAQAGELLAEFVLAMQHGLGLNKILSTIHPYPTLAEANKHAAGEWRRAHVPQRLLAWAEHYHAWQRWGV
ncbi:FAD-dependent oxidoreductase [Pseudogulbenkiania subflava]|uniref:Pyruvate/2-oxoglutarate dehydrogenase complex, dihydrolipoamide dehydrogenase (E3) component n=1 Tax=Pseudogulbenkiania subflava DSM 22618 TaxID=1123014 RepID=A0A1Y6C676_9NEIS|nr:bifunctional TVP38/TMEM64 family protein/FAD-dependent oxidoreductase [Pseudogulbenkiania subflava]SMF23308.1 Pyruvate/2-oxoglutarate dehydrogenase complex, dihydrolipoamide dehydrogenase (E3) component [Pseudogulbenkiania subflava DSM 22618]SMF32666.1 Pyruvate/2-oxoglutarate dehydrogenase complex, dihydrolipoamide dehydrogenase (E3) component [Pseudogulbenkiania subflava DSM 22618]SMF47711.1 Pyruvate/2-oxoglutarate dehydrogenase complex, dihydrolipoamide dehydrogenase (E3) component [Pseudog